MYFSGKVGSRPSTSTPSAPPSPASPEPSAKVSEKMRGTGRPMPRATTPSSTAARSRAPKRVRTSPKCSAATTAPQSRIRKIR